MFKNLTLPSLMLAATVAFLGAPSSQIAAATCGGPGEVLCKTNEACAGILFFRQCTTTYDYWQSDEEEPEYPETTNTIGFH
ncbi:MAG: hypothetical protein EA351_07295 [Gemmatimonadales bacterium]|nr:MAG: hypothetical protein EA351_07295 [Gemmatimonadales bacterium]